MEEPGPSYGPFNIINFNDLLIGESLGDGKKGKTYRCKYFFDDYAFKTYSKRCRNLDPCEEEVEQEAEAKKFMNLGNNQNIVELIGQGEVSNGVSFLLTELCDCDLRHLVFERGLDEHPEFHNFVILEIVKGLECLHQNGMVHSDLNLAKVLVKRTENGCVLKLCGFGNCFICQSDGCIVSFGFIASESTGSLELDVDYAFPNSSWQEDVHALGALMWVLLNGKNANSIGTRDASETGYVYNQIMGRCQDENGICPTATEVKDILKAVKRPENRFVEPEGVGTTKNALGCGTKDTDAFNATENDCQHYEKTRKAFTGFVEDNVPRRDKNLLSVMMKAIARCCSRFITSKAEDTFLQVSELLDFDQSVLENYIAEKGFMEKLYIMQVCSAGKDKQNFTDLLKILSRHPENRRLCENPSVQRGTDGVHGAVTLHNASKHDGTWNHGLTKRTHETTHGEMFCKFDIQSCLVQGHCTQGERAVNNFTEQNVGGILPDFVDNLLSDDKSQEGRFRTKSNIAVLEQANIPSLQNKIFDIGSTGTKFRGKAEESSMPSMDVNHINANATTHENQGYYKGSKRELEDTHTHSVEQTCEHLRSLEPFFGLSPVKANACCSTVGCNDKSTYICFQCQQGFCGDKFTGHANEHYLNTLHHLWSSVDSSIKRCCLCDNHISRKLRKDKAELLKIIDQNSSNTLVNLPMFTLAGVHLPCIHVSNVLEFRKTLPLPDWKCGQKGCTSVANMSLCMTCAKFFCGDAENQHIQLHQLVRESHQIYLNFDDLAIYCGKCDLKLDPREHPNLFIAWSHYAHLK